jgi:YidC/Oxa1 family membrane protein insertase
MTLILNIAYSISGSYGVSIIFLSLIVNVLILPLYYMADRWKSEDKLLQDRMKPEINNIKKYYKGQERHYYIQTIYRRYNYHPISSVKASAGFLIQIPFFFAAFHLLSNFEPINGVSFLIFKDLGSPDGLLFGINILPFIMTAFNILSLYVYSDSATKSEKIQLWAMALLFLVLLYASPSALLLYWTLNNIFSMFKNIADHSSEFKDKLNKRYLSITTILSRVNLLNRLTFLDKISLDNSKTIFLLSVAIIFMTILIIHPINLYNSTNDFNGAKIYKIIFTSISYVTLITLFSYVLYILSSDKFKKILALFSLYTLIGVFLYSFVIIIDYGEMNKFEFRNPQALIMPIFGVILEIISVLFLFIVVVKFLFRYEKYIVRFLLVMIGLFSIFTLKSLYSFSILRDDTYLLEYDEKDYNRIYQQEHENTLSFSKDKNIVIFLLDGGNMSSIYDLVKNRDNSILKNYTGFTIYENVLSTSTATRGSLASILGGHNYTADAMASKDKKTIQEDFDEAYAVYPDAFSSEGYSLSYFRSQFISSLDILKDKGVYLSNLDFYERSLPQNIKDDISKVYTNIDFSKILYMVSLFKASPLSMKNFIYGDSYWHNANSKEQKYTLAIQWRLADYGFFNSLINSSNLNSSKKTFKFLHLNIPHPPNALDINGKLNPANSSYDIEAYKTFEYISNFIDWLKLNKVYDKTKIVILSDHGWWRDDNKYFSKDFRKYVPIGFENKMDTSITQPIFMVKEFNSNNKVEVSNRFMSNADLASIVCSSLENGCAIDDIDPRYSNSSRELSISSANFRINRKEGIHQSSFLIKEKYIVKDSIFDYKNWEKIE